MYFAVESRKYSLIVSKFEEQRGTVVKVFDSGVEASLVQFPREPKMCFHDFLLNYCFWLVGQGIVDDKDLAVSSNQGNF